MPGPVQVTNLGFDTLPLSGQHWNFSHNLQRSLCNEFKWTYHICKRPSRHQCPRSSPSEISEGICAQRNPHIQTMAHASPTSQTLEAHQPTTPPCMPSLPTTCPCCTHTYATAVTGPYMCTMICRATCCRPAGSSPQVPSCIWTHRFLQSTLSCRNGAHSETASCGHERQLLYALTTSLPRFNGLTSVPSCVLEPENGGEKNNRQSEMRRRCLPLRLSVPVGTSGFTHQFGFSGQGWGAHAHADGPAVNDGVLLLRGIEELSLAGIDISLHTGKPWIEGRATVLPMKWAYIDHLSIKNGGCERLSKYIVLTPTFCA